MLGVVDLQIVVIADLGQEGVAVRGLEVGIESRRIVIGDGLRRTMDRWAGMGLATTRRPVRLVPHVMLGQSVILVEPALSWVCSVLLQGHCWYTRLPVSIARVRGALWQ